MGVPIPPGFCIVGSFIQVIFVGFIPTEKFSGPVNTVIFSFDFKNLQHQFSQLLSCWVSGIPGQPQQTHTLNMNQTTLHNGIRNWLPDGF